MAPDTSSERSDHIECTTRRGEDVERRLVEQGYDLKQDVRAYWNRKPCGTEVTEAPRLSRAYFDQIEAYRYAVEPEILAFAQFAQAHGKRVLEVGVGAGTDLVHWVRAGALATGIDLTEEATELARTRLELDRVKAALVQADCENLPFPEGSFDLVYSWGVIHHTADTWRALDEILRVCRPEGTCKVMVYNLHSVASLKTWMRYCLLRGRPYHSLSWALWHHMESRGTKAFTRRQLERELERRGVVRVTIGSGLSYYDKPQSSEPLANRILTLGAQAVAIVLGWRAPGWFMTAEFQKPPA